MVGNLSKFWIGHNGTKIKIYLIFIQHHDENYVYTVTDSKRHSQHIAIITLVISVLLIKRVCLAGWMFVCITTSY